MAKRRYRRRQHDRRRNRIRIPPPTDGWLLTELCKFTSLSPATIKRYVKLGMLARPVFRGRATRYDRNTLLRLTAIHQLKLNGVTYLVHLRQALDKVVASGLERWVMAQPMPHRLAAVLRPAGSSEPTAQAVSDQSRQVQPQAAQPQAIQPHAALVQTVQPQQGSGAVVASAPSTQSARLIDGSAANTATQSVVSPNGGAASSEWETLVLLPGLELRIDVNRGVNLLRIAARLCEHVTTLAAASVT